MTSFTQRMFNILDSQKCDVRVSVPRIVMYPPTVFLLGVRRHYVGVAGRVFVLFNEIASAVLIWEFVGTGSGTGTLVGHKMALCGHLLLLPLVLMVLLPVTRPRPSAIHHRPPAGETTPFVSLWPDTNWGVVHFLHDINR